MGRVSVWQKWRSYFTEVSLMKTASELNPNLELKLVKGQFQLCTENAIYSYGLKYDNFDSAFELIPWSTLAVKNALVLGLGTGSIMELIERKYKQMIEFDCVEYDREVITIFDEWVKPKLSSKILLIQEDAFDFCKQNKKKYDLICVDLFLDSWVPDQFETIEFLEFLKSQLNPEAILIFNRLADRENELKKNEFFLKTKFSKVFTQYDILKLDTNWMFFNRTLKKN